MNLVKAFLIKNIVLISTCSNNNVVYSPDKIILKIQVKPKKQSQIKSDICSPSEIHKRFHQ